MLKGILQRTFRVALRQRSFNSTKGKKLEKPEAYCRAAFANVPRLARYPFQLISTAGQIAAERRANERDAKSERGTRGAGIPGARIEAPRGPFSIGKGVRARGRTWRGLRGQFRTSARARLPRARRKKRKGKKRPRSPWRARGVQLEAHLANLG